MPYTHGHAIFNICVIDYFLLQRGKLCNSNSNGDDDDNDNDNNNFVDGGDDVNVVDGEGGGSCNN